MVIIKHHLQFIFTYVELDLDSLELDSTFSKHTRLFYFLKKLCWLECYFLKQ